MRQKPCYPSCGIAVDQQGIVYDADLGNNTIRKGVFSEYAPAHSVFHSSPRNTGKLLVTLSPSQAQGQWRFPWELGWRQSGTVATNLAVDNSHSSYTVEMRSVPGWLAFPSSFPVTVTGNGVDSVTTNVYYPTINSADTNIGGGTLMVNLGANPPTGAGWRFLGDNSPFLPSGYTTNLLPGTYLIEFAGPFDKRVTPANLSVQVAAGRPTVISVSYPLAQSPPAGLELPQPVALVDLQDQTNFPFGFNGQLQSDLGYGSGVVVQPNVVLTAAHLVFNDQSLSYVQQAWWRYQREAGAVEPQPMAARGWYVLSGYASQRTNDLDSGLYGPDQSTAQSRNLDVAALYFLSSAAGGGYGGYLPSDAVPNPWLSSTSLKMLVGYPVDGSLFGDTNVAPGKMYQTTPQPYPLVEANDPVFNQQVYLATWFLSYPGNSGGPLYVRYNGYYYPAGVYLGTLYNGIEPYASLVRAIDSNVVNLVTLAAELGDAGTNFTGGGVITLVAGAGTSIANPAYVQVRLGPAAAITAGAGWRLHGDPTFGTGADYTRTVTSTNAQIEFANLPGWNAPTTQTVLLVPGIINLVSDAFYTPKPPIMEVDQLQGLRLIGTAATSYRLEYRPSLSSGQWVGLSTNTLGATPSLLLSDPFTNGPAGYYRAVWLP